jgi:putative FmdB family regulatory protein
MPVYEYECSACGHRFEEWQKMSDKPIKTCPKCKAKKVEKLISATSFHLKGGGWYSDLYSSKKSGDSKGSSGGGEGGGGGTETKAESKKESAPAKETKAEKPAKKDGGKKSTAAA